MAKLELTHSAWDLRNVVLKTGAVLLALLSRLSGFFLSFLDARAREKRKGNVKSNSNID